MATGLRQSCFVDMPFGSKPDHKTGATIDFDQIFLEGIKPAVEAKGLECIRGDHETTGGIIHTAMFARLLLSEFVIADLTTANPNVFYELGVRHAAKPYTTIPIFATIGDLPFDVALVRAIPYALENGKLTPASAASLREAIMNRIGRALEGPVAKDSPLFDLFDGFPGIELSHELTDVFRDRVSYSDTFKQRLEAARCDADTQDEARSALVGIEAELGDLRTIERGVLVDLLLSYRAVEAWQNMIDLYDRMPGDVQNATLVCQQLAFALNRTGEAKNRKRAVRLLEQVLSGSGASAETYGLLGRIYKDLYREALATNNLKAAGYLDRAIEAYRRGFECEPVDYYPGINAITLLLQKATAEAVSDAERLAPLVAFAVARRGGAESSDYWDLATVLELAAINCDDLMIERVLPRALAAANEAFQPKTTADNLQLLLNQRGSDASAALLGAHEHLLQRYQELKEGTL